MPLNGIGLTVLNNRAERKRMNQKTPPKSILYVGDRYRIDNPIREALERKYDLTAYSNLDDKVIDFIRQLLRNKKLDAMITNMPPNAIHYDPNPAYKVALMGNLYKDSLGVLKEIKRLIDIPIVIYTRADNSPAVYAAFLKVGDYVIHTSEKCNKDFLRISVELERLLQKYENIPSQIEAPVIKTRNGYSIAKVRFNLNNGLNVVSIATICRECRKYEKDIFLKRVGSVDNPQKIYNGKKVMDFIMSPGIGEGENITIRVEGVGDEAKRMARRLYAAFGSRYYFTMDLDRFENNSP
jgi:phosphotransferase system HPr-like phosphotransfer protein